ncbi:Macoilin [Bagarius yarrelli]|uniref:Macoilin n=1 Tax=Bagarius yarrelli TaxID=175774 RepID=A0A556V244_BAGYA|nr:Macoilin [Bagarius yarrelli]
MKKRCLDVAKLRKMKKIGLTEKISESAYSFLKFMTVWIVVLLADFILEFRLEYLWPCWLFLGTVYTTFHCHGLAICMVFVCAAFTLDIFCLIFVPLHWLFFAASTYVLLNYIWHTESKWRTKPGPMQYPCPNDAGLSEDKQELEDCLQLHKMQGRTERDVGDARIRESNPQPPGSKHHGVETRPGQTQLSDIPEHLPHEEQSGKAARVSRGTQAKVQKNAVNVVANKAEKKLKNLSKAISSSAGDAAERSTNIQGLHNPHAEQLARLDQEMRRLKVELQTSRQNEQELRSHVCNLTNSENSLRPEISLLRHANELLHNKLQYLSKSRQKDKQSCSVLEKKVRMESESRLTVEKQLAEIRCQKLDEAAFLLRNASNRQEHSETQLLRKRARDLDTEYKQLQLDYQGRDNRVLALEKEVESLQKLRCTEQEADALLSALSSLQDKAQHLEYNLSAETRLKLDLFSALGDARRQLEIAQVKLLKQDQEIKEMKQKIAEVMAVSPGVSYTNPRSTVPQYLKFLNSERYVLNPRGLMYQCLRK